MNPKYLNLSRSQLVLAWSKSRYNHYSDKRKQLFHDGLEKLYDVLMSIDFFDSKYQSDDLSFFRNVLEFFKNSLNLLDNNTISSVPHEIIECLNVAAHQWLTDFDDYIIVMENGPYAIKPLVEDKRVFYNSIKTKLGVEFKHILLAVSMPQQLYRDYLTNVCLFHELGHFVDAKYKISDEVIQELLNKWLNGEKDEVEKWLKTGEQPFAVSSKIGTTSYYSTNGATISYIKEYFADLFGSQYIDSNHLYYLEYLSVNSKKDGLTHPSFDKRKEMQNDFFKGTDTNVVLNLICEKTKAISAYELKSRTITLDTIEIFNLVPTTLNNEDELLSIFNLGWELYMQGPRDIETTNKLTKPLSSDKLYDIVNNT